MVVGGGRVLGIDLGQRRVGLALSDPTGMIALPLTTVLRDGTDSWFDELCALVSEHEIGTLLIGLPLDQHGEEGEAAHAARVIGLRLGAAVELPVEFWDERFSTVESVASLREQGVSARDQRSIVDQVAAQLCLQGYLDRQSDAEGDRR